MFFKNATRQTREAKGTRTNTPAPSVIETAHSDDERSKNELQRQMYERIAQGNALEEAEEHARRMWAGR